MTKLNTTLLKDLPVKKTSITDNDYVVVTGGGTKKLKVKDITKDLEETTTELSSQLETKAKQIDLDTTNARIDVFTSLAEGSTTGDAELIDARIIDGTIYTNVGGAIRNTRKDIINTIKDGRTRINFIWESGTIVTGGGDSDNNKRIRFVENVDFTSIGIDEIYIKVPTGYAIIPIAYKKTSDEVLFGEFNSSSHTYKFQTNYTYRFVIKKSDDSEIDVNVASLFEFNYKDRFYADTLYDLLSEDIYKINSCSYTTFSPTWKVAYYIKSDGGLQGNDTACITEDYLIYDNEYTPLEFVINDTISGFTSKFKIGIIKYNLDNTYVSGIYEFYAKDEIPKLEIGYKYRFALATETWEKFTADNIDDNILNSILKINQNSITRQLYNDINDIKDVINDIKDVINNLKYKGKKSNFLGDSITYGIASSVTYDKYLQEMWGLDTIRNYGIAGSTISSHSESMATRCLSMDDDSDLNFVFGGTNDFYRNIPLGEFYTVDSNGTRTFLYDNDTFKGALNLLFKNMKVKYIGKEVICLTPLHRELYTDDSGSQPTELEKNSIGLYFEEYVEAIKEACKIWSVKCIDLYAESGLQPNIPEIKAKYFGQGDGLHINKYGHKVVAECIDRNM